MGKDTSQDMSLYDHLEELRKVLLISITALVVASVVVYALFLDNLMSLITTPITNLGFQPVIIGVTEGFFVRLKIAVFGGLVFATPIIVWQVLRFVFPALYENEKRAAIVLLFSGVILYVAGVIFSYFNILELALRLMLLEYSAGLSPMISFEKYLSFVMMMMLPFGLICEIPIITLVLTRVGIITPDFMRKNRKFVILASFILAALLTPPDGISQVVLAVPMIVFYELSIIISRLTVKRKNVIK